MNPTSKTIYWDYNATAPVREAVKTRIAEALDRYPGNPSSTHSLGQSARAYIERVRRKAAESLGVDPGEIIFTGSATETNLFALRGYWLANKKSASPTPKVLASRIEHPSVCKNLDFLAETEGIEIVEIPRLPSGLTDLPKMEELLKREKFWLISLHGASNETGIIQDWNKVAKLAARNKTPMHSDMVQYFGRLPLSFKSSPLNSATISFHKSGGVRSCSLYYLKRDTNWIPCLVGGAQEKKRWAGTENILGIASIDALFDELPAMIAGYQGPVQKIRDEFEKQLIKAIPEVKIVGQEVERLPNTSYCIFPGLPSDALLMALDVSDICASAGSACSSGLSLPSSTLEKLGYSPKEAQSAIRFSLGETCCDTQIDKVIDVIQTAIARFKTK